MWKILGHHMASSSCFNQMVEETKEVFIWQNISKIQMMPCVTFLSYHV
jgi:hypothetical protein